MLLIGEINRPHSGPYLRTIHGSQDFQSSSVVELHQLIIRFSFLSYAQHVLQYIKTLCSAQCTGESHGSSFNMPWVASNPVNFVFLGLARVKNWTAPPSQVEIILSPGTFCIPSCDNWVFYSSRLCTCIYHKPIAQPRLYLKCIDWRQLCRSTLLFLFTNCSFVVIFSLQLFTFIITSSWKL